MLVKLGNPSRKNKAATIVIDDFDVWNLDHTLALIIVPALKVLQKKKQGAPFVENTDVPEHLRATKEELKHNDTGGDTDKHYFERWEYVLDEMIWAFQQKLEDWEEQFHSGETDMHWKKIEKNDTGEDLYEMVNGPNHTFEVDLEGMKKYQSRIDTGLILFAKYYNNLWD